MKSDVKRLTKNTMFLYIRMFLAMAVGLFTSRIVFEALGVENYGIYGVVGGITAMMSFFNSTLAGATSRFVSFELGTRNHEKLRDTMATAIVIHFMLAIIVVLLGETIGLWFLNNKLQIPEGRMSAARVVYQLSLIGAVFGIMTTPYNADIIANEKMSIYAYFEIINVLLKLVIAYLLMLDSGDRLILYSALMLSVSVIVFLFYKIYCNKKFPESKFKLIFNKELIKRQLSFSGYNIIGNLGFVVNTQGTNFLINIFWGVIYNASVSIATTISSVINGFVSNINTAFKPAIIKEYAQNNVSTVSNYINLATISSLYLLVIIGIPITVNINYVIKLWLNDVPSYSGIFTILIFCDIILVNFRLIITMGIHAVGNVKYNSLINGISHCVNPLLVYFLFKIGCPIYYSYISLIFIDVFLCVSSSIILKKLEPNISLSKSIIKFSEGILFTFIIWFALKICWVDRSGENIINLFISFLFNLLLSSVFFYCIILSKSQKSILFSSFKKMFQSRHQ